jgi:hypothetical protein
MIRFQIYGVRLNVAKHETINFTSNQTAIPKPTDLGSEAFCKVAPPLEMPRPTQKPPTLNTIRI